MASWSSASLLNLPPILKINKARFLLLPLQHEIWRSHHPARGAATLVLLPTTGAGAEGAQSIWSQPAPRLASRASSEDEQMDARWRHARTRAGTRGHMGAWRTPLAVPVTFLIRQSTQSNGCCHRPELTGSFQKQRMWKQRGAGLLFPWQRQPRAPAPQPALPAKVSWPQPIDHTGHVPHCHGLAQASEDAQWHR